MEKFSFQTQPQQFALNHGPSKFTLSANQRGGNRFKGFTRDFLIYATHKSEKLAIYCHRRNWERNLLLCAFRAAYVLYSASASHFTSRDDKVSGAKIILLSSTGKRFELFVRCMKSELFTSERTTPFRPSPLTPPGAFVRCFTSSQVITKSVPKTSQITYAVERNNFKFCNSQSEFLILADVFVSSTNTQPSTEVSFQLGNQN